MRLPTLTFVTLLPLVLAVPTPSRTRDVTATPPRISPASIAPPLPNYLPLSGFHSFFGIVPAVANLTARDDGALDLELRGLGDDGSNIPGLERRDQQVLSKSQILLAQKAIAASCVGSDSNDTYISSLFYYGGAGTTVYLCQGATISLTNAVFFSAADQTLTTVGAPTGTSRATLVVTAADQSCAIYGIVQGGDNIAVRNIQVDGARPALGILVGGIGLIELGGNAVGHVVDSVHAYEPRGWTAVHALEGTNNQCSGMVITNNQIGPAGHAPTGATQFRRGADTTGTYTPGQWADGISLACKASTVRGNVVTDATDGGIVIFGAPGSTISGNTIITNDRQLLCGIDMVDWSPFSGSFTGTNVIKNTIIASGNFMKLGIAIGGLAVGVDNRTISRTYGGNVQGNRFQSGRTGYFGYAIGMAGHENITILANDARQANFGSIESTSCFTSLFTLPAPQSFIADQWTTPGAVLQKGFTMSTLALLVCRGPGKVTTIGGVAG